jgi:cyclopropane-fatty-acyl-phospholipid synthase
VPQRRQLRNVRVITADMNDFATDDRFDRVVSVEMFEHMRNHARADAPHRRLAAPGRQALRAHLRARPQRPTCSRPAGRQNWMGRYFFTGGIMPADDLLPSYQRDLRLEEQWRQDGTHYRRRPTRGSRTLDAHRDEILAIFEQGLWAGREAALAPSLAVFFMACAEMFGYADGQEWWVAHYLFHKP